MKLPNIFGSSTTVNTRGAAKASSFADEVREREGEREQARLDRENDKFEGKRSEERGRCFTVAQLRSPETGSQLDGVLLDASPNGVTFRPAASYIQEMDGEQIVVVCQELLRVGIVRSTRPDGYGIQLLEALAESDLDVIYRSSIDLLPSSVA